MAINSQEYLRGRFKGLQEIHDTGKLWKVTCKMAKRIISESNSEEKQFWQGYLDSAKKG